MRKKIVSLLLALLMLMPANIAVFAANESNAPAQASAEAAGYPDQLKKSGFEAIEAIEPYEEDEKVTVIIELRSAAMIGSGSVSGDEVQTSEDRKAILNEQKSVQNVISCNILDGQMLEIQHSYTLVTNGFAAEVPYGKLDEIRALPEVASVYIAPVFKIAPDMQPGTTTVGGMENATGYNGEGMVIAIVDSGLELGHQSFAEAPNSPAISQSSVADALSGYELHAESDLPGLGADQVYYSAKVPFAFDYADKDTDVNPGSAGDHGTHVAGIAAANAVVVSDVVGIAPGAQLLAMKVFSSEGSGGATWDDILAAIDDAVYLGADVINLSLGSVSGFGTAEGDEGIIAVLERVVDAGVMLSVSAGDEYNSAFGNKFGNDRALASNPDYGTVASPSSYGPSMSVASVENAGTIQSAYFTVGEKKIAYIDKTEDGDEDVPEDAPGFKSLGTAELGYVVVPGYGEANDYAGLDVKGKIALISRGEITYDDKMDVSKAAGAVAILIYNNELGIADLQLENYDLPAASITQADGAYLIRLAGAEGKLSISATNGEVENHSSGQMSDFSSWGVTPELTLKPDIAGPGGNIKSTSTGNSYSVKSGTSMSSPFVTGAMAVVKQYIEKEHADECAPGAERANLVNAVIMSTADIVISDNETPVSPRKQGAGSVSVDNAVNSAGYITVPGMDRPKIELGDDVDKTGVYTMSFDVHNYSEAEVSYILSGTVQTDGAEITKQYMGENVRQITGQPFSLGTAIPKQTVTVAAGGTERVNVSFRLINADKAHINKSFPNGIYIEGFLTMTPAGGGVMLSVPYMGFYGDWTQASAIDRGYCWDDIDNKENWATQYSNTAAVSSTRNTITTYLGDNPYHDGVTYLADRNAISPNQDDILDKLDILYTGLLRNVRTLSYTIVNANDATDVYYQKTVDYECKSVYSRDHSRIVPSGVERRSKIDPWVGTDGGGLDLPNGAKAVVTVSCTLPYDKHEVNNECLSWSFPITVDIEEPVASDIEAREEGGKFYVDLTVSDNEYVSNVLFANASSGKALGSYPVAEAAAGASTQLSCDVSGYGRDLTIIVNDYAGNRKEYEVTVAGNSDDAEDIVPTKSIFKQDFENGLFPHDGWTLKSDSAASWCGATREGSGVAFCDSVVEAQNEWLISPAIDLSAQEAKAAMIFDFNTSLYYGTHLRRHNLLVKASTDGQNWDTIWQLWDLGKNDDESWVTTQARVKIPEKYQDEAGVQFAFVYEGKDGATLWIDNINVYVEDNNVTHIITATAGGGGSITPVGDVVVTGGSSQSFTIEAAEGHKIAQVLADGESLGAVSEYTFENVNAEHTITALFEELPNSIVSVDAQTVIQLPFGTAEADLNLPETVGAALDDGSKRDFAVTWNCPDYDSHTAGSYSFEGTLTIIAGVVNPDNLKAVQIVAVEAEPETLYQLRVNGGKGGGEYAAGTNVSITADEPPTGKDFSGWIVSGATLQDESQASTSFVMPKNDVTITATWKGISTSPVNPPMVSGNAINIQKSADGKITSDHCRAAKGVTITVSAVPDSGYEISRLTVTDANGSFVEVTKIGAHKYVFIMPATSVTLRASFAKDGFPFADVGTGHWAYDNIAWIHDNGLMNGVTDSLFDPGGGVTREQVWTVLARLHGEEPANFEEARAWAVNNDISDGTNPKMDIPRQQLVALVFRYAQMRGYDASARADLTGFANSGDISEYAKDAMSWAVAMKIVEGTSGTSLNPDGTAGRAQFAAIIQRFIWNI